MEVQGYPNYVIYEDGRVWSKGRNKYMKDIITKSGYLRVGLSNKSGLKHFLISRLVALNYIPNPNNYCEVHHEDGNKLNNHISNLRWVSARENSNSHQNIRRNNKSGHKGIIYDKSRDKWKYEKIYYDNKWGKRFKSKTDALCYKFIILLKIRGSILIHI